MREVNASHVALIRQVERSKTICLHGLDFVVFAPVNIRPPSLAGTVDDMSWLDLIEDISNFLLLFHSNRGSMYNLALMLEEIDYLTTEGIPVVAKDLLGNYPRKVYFFPTSGRVLVKKLRTMHNDTIIERELSYSETLRRAKVEGEVELFS